MKYREYKVNDDGLEKRLGVLGEVHLYNAAESAIAEVIVPTYDTIGMEGSGKSTVFNSLLALVYTPSGLAYAAATGRLKSSADQIAKKHHKQIIRLEESENVTFPFLQKLSIITMGLISIPLVPFDIYRYLKFGDPSCEGTEAYQKRLEIEQKNGLLTKFQNYAFKNNFPIRDAMMADKAIEILQTRSNNVLVICGKKHFPGVTAHLQKKLDLEERASFESVSDFSQKDIAKRLTHNI
ncbi:MAG: hypothetical protein Q8R37_00275 [Nanoarchaeota archaeon]|nr:hypothetical protein [Nanoarchaeota archaeon]